MKQVNKPRTAAHSAGRKWSKENKKKNYLEHKIGKTFKLIVEFSQLPPIHSAAAHFDSTWTPNLSWPHT